MSPELLLIEDMPSLQMVYEAILRKSGYSVTSAGTAGDGLVKFRALLPSVVLLDLMLPDRDGLDLMGDMLAISPQTRVIVITANVSVNKAVAAMRAGAFEFLVKPFDESRLISVIESARPSAPAQPEGGELSVGEDPVEPEFLGSSSRMREVRQRIAAISQSSASVFIIGESGTGKESCARAVHAASPRQGAPFIPFNCAAGPADMVESELFGHAKGAFPAAVADKEGAAAEADGGTLFLNEICEMDLTVQSRLLRFLRTGQFQPLGSYRARQADVRIICSTNKDPIEAVKAGRLREDLFYRLHVVPINLPALRERDEDVIEIANAMLSRLAAEEGKAFSALAPDVAALFRRLPWPGNVRQLLNVLRNVVVLNAGATVSATMLPLEILHLSEASGHVAGAADPEEGSDATGGLIGRPLAEIERIVIEETIVLAGGSVTRAAQILEVAPSTLYRKLGAWGADDAKRLR